MLHLLTGADFLGALSICGGFVSGYVMPLLVSCSFLLLICLSVPSISRHCTDLHRLL
ncbi:hypothetical protein N8563_00920 [bacterium]|nr:hypothetical protein [bacterium]